MIEPSGDRPAPVTLAQAFWYWLRLGFISFGGPAGQIAIMHADLVERARWISERRFLHALNYCMVLPGPEAQQLATYIGWLMHRTWGGLIAGGLFVLPSFVILVALSWIYMRFGHLPALAGVLYGIKPAVTAIVLFAACRIGARVLRHPLLWIIAAAAFVAARGFDVAFPLIIVLAGVVGWVASYLAPNAFVAEGAHGGQGRRYGAALIDDDTPAPAHARWSRARALRVGAVFGVIWVVGMAGLAAAAGWESTLAQMGWFFTKAALLTFGGAYAVLPYVHQGAVEHYGWLTATQMLDGLALGETTPGPLIMVVTFVGFVGGWSRQLLGPDALFFSGLLAACVTTFFTFLPSFLLILLGAPFVESTHGRLRLTAPLTGISAAVVGVIVNLAVFFAQHVFWPRGDGMSFDWAAAAIAAAAFAALWRFKASVVAVIAGCGAVGLLMRLTIGPPG